MTPEPIVKGIDQVKREYAGVMLRRPDVIAFGIGPRDSLVVHVTDTYPAGPQLPPELDGYRVVIVQSSPFRKLPASRIKKAR